MTNKVINYFSILPGNNSTAIQKALEKRGVWSSLPPEKDYLHATFHWQQLNYSPKIYEQFNELARMYPSKHVHISTFFSVFVKSFRYESCNYNKIWTYQNTEIFLQSLRSPFKQTYFLSHTNLFCVTISDYNIEFRLTKKLRNLKTLRKSLINCRKKSSLNKRYRKSTVRKIFGLSSHNLITKVKE